MVSPPRGQRNFFRRLPQAGLFQRRSVQLGTARPPRTAPFRRRPKRRIAHPFVDRNGAWDSRPTGLLPSRGRPLAGKSRIFSPVVFTASKVSDARSPWSSGGGWDLMKGRKNPGDRGNIAVFGLQFPAAAGLRGVAEGRFWPGRRFRKWIWPGSGGLAGSGSGSRRNHIGRQSCFYVYPAFLPWRTPLVNWPEN